MIRRMLILGAMALALFVPAAHAQYIPGQPGASVSDSTVSSGDTVTVTVTCDVPAGTDVTVFVDGTAAGSGQTDADGTVTVDVTITGAPGSTHQITNSCNSAVLTVTVVGATSTTAPSPSAGALPRTGTDSSLPLAKIAIVLIAAGGLLIVAARDRSKKATA